jgi:hypothetical protein
LSPSQVRLGAVTAGTRREIEWITRHMRRVFPREWEAFAALVPAEQRDGDLAAGYARLLSDPDPTVRERAARAWCTWEDTQVSLMPGWRPDPRYEDSGFRLVFAPDGDAFLEPFLLLDRRACGHGGFGFAAGPVLFGLGDEYTGGVISYERVEAELLEPHLEHQRARFIEELMSVFGLGRLPWCLKPTLAVLRASSRDRYPPTAPPTAPCSLTASKTVRKPLFAGTSTCR